MRISDCSDKTIQVSLTRGGMSPLTFSLPPSQVAMCSRSLVFEIVAQQPTEFIHLVNDSIRKTRVVLICLSRLNPS
jgi:hypothetical protein